MQIKRTISGQETKKTLYSLIFTMTLLLIGTTVMAVSEDRQTVVKRCTTIIIGKDVSADGSVMIAHNEDLDGNCAHHFIVVPAEEHNSGEMVTTYYGAKVPQVARTYAYTATTIFDKDFVPGDITTGINEYQVSVANNLAFQREPVPMISCKGRILWTEYSKFILERAKSAREAVEIIGNLAHTYKHCGSGTMIGVTDPEEGWWIEIAQQGQWVAERVADNGFGVRANTYAIREVDFNDSKNFLYSDDLVSYAEERGWYDSEEGNFDFTAVYANQFIANSDSNTHRTWQVERMLSTFEPEVRPQDLMSILRNHYEGTTYDETNGYVDGSPHQTSEYTLCNITTQLSSVCQSRGWLPSEIGAICWRALFTPCTGTYTPWYLGSKKIPAPFQQGTDHYSSSSAYWTFKKLSMAIEPHYGQRILHTQNTWQDFESGYFEEQNNIEKRAIALYSSKGVTAAEKYLGAYSSSIALQALLEADNLFRDLLRMKLD